MNMKLSLLASAGLLFASPAFAGQTLSLEPFSGVTASDGARVIVRHGGAQQVTITEGDNQQSLVEVRGTSLVIEGCRHWCSHDYHLTVEITTPELTAVKAEDGASITAQGQFPGQNNLATVAEDGGSVDVRAMRAANASAKAEDGGDIDVSATSTLSAVAEDGGNITYYGHPTVNLHSDDGGNIEQGS